MLSRFLEFITKYVKEIFDKEDFPLPNKDGLYPIKYSHNHELRCPNCGHTSWSILDYTIIRCSTCFNTYDNYGVLGLKIKQQINEEYNKNIHIVHLTNNDRFKCGSSNI